MLYRLPDQRVMYRNPPAFSGQNLGWFGDQRPVSGVRGSVSRVVIDPLSAIMHNCGNLSEPLCAHPTTSVVSIHPGQYVGRVPSWEDQGSP